MSDWRIDPEAAQRDAEAFAEQWVRAFAVLAKAEEVSLGTAAKEEVFRDGKVVLYRYRAAPDVEPGKRVRAPLVLCYALVNRPYMMDLQEDRSLIRRLLAEGVDVYLIDWGYPDGGDRFLGLEDYICGYLHRCIEAAAQHSGHERVNLLGVCQGGTMSLCYAALYPRRLRNLITMVTPVDFCTDDNTLMKWGRDLDLDVLLDASGNVPGEFLNMAFVGLMPLRLASQKYVDLLGQMEQPGALANFLRMEHWIFDSPDLAGELFREFVLKFVRGNGFVTRALDIAGRQVDLKNIRMPVLNIYATQDHLVPPSSSLPLEGLVGSDDYTLMPFAGGHIGLYVSGSAQRTIPPSIGDWLRARDD